VPNRFETANRHCLGRQSKVHAALLEWGGHGLAMRQFARSIYRNVPFKRIAFDFLRNRLGMTPRFYQHLHFRGPFELWIDEQHSITLFSEGNIVENDLFWLGFGNGWEGTSLRLWRRICERSDGIVLDIGANSGVYALVAAKVGRSDVLAFEPLARVADLLRRNIELNHLPVRVEQSAVSNRDGEATI
jgi:hypothetical protein